MSQFATSVIDVGRGTLVSFKSRGQLVAGVGLILLFAFASMVSSGYTADHIKRSGCDMSKDAKLKDAYSWSTGSAVASAVVVVAMIGVLVKIGLKPKAV